MQTSWNSSIGNKVFEIKPPISYWKHQERSCFGWNGNRSYSHSYLLLGEEELHCLSCDAPFDKSLPFGNSDDFAQMRNKYFHFNNMKQLFQDNLLIKEINLFDRI